LTEESTEERMKVYNREQKHGDLAPEFWGVAELSRSSGSTND